MPPKRQDIQTFWSRWQIEPDSASEFPRLKTRVYAVVKELLWDGLPGSELSALARSYVVIRGIEPTIALLDQINGCKDVRELAVVLQALLWAAHDTPAARHLEKLIPRLNFVFDLSPNVLLHIYPQSGVPMLLPGGAKLLDDELVETNLDWLQRYPTAARAFGESLRIYLSKDEGKYRNLLDNLRFSIEQLLREVLGNKKSLENQKAEFLRWVGSRGVHSSIVNMYHDLLFDGFTRYQNDAVKHDEKYAPQEIEFMIYVTGTFLRFLLQMADNTSTESGQK